MSERPVEALFIKFLTRDQQNSGSRCIELVKFLCHHILSGRLKRWTRIAIRQFMPVHWVQLQLLLQDCTLQKILAQLKVKVVQFRFLSYCMWAWALSPSACTKAGGAPDACGFWKLNQANADLINKAKREGRRIIAVGTTSVRLLESVAKDDGTVQPGEGWTSIFIYPGFHFSRASMGLSQTFTFHVPHC